MPLVAYGINHHTAPIRVREKLAFNSTELSNALHQLTQHHAINEAVILSTCNRTEIYATTDNVSAIQTWFMRQKELSDIDLSHYCYAHHEIHAVRHLMRVASGLDSMILGEPQIVGQMKQAYQVAENAGVIGDVLKLVFPAVFAASKQVRSQTDIGAHSISLAYTVTQLSKKIFHQLTDTTILLMGAGETIELIATHLRGVGVKKIIIANRTIEKSHCIAKAVQAHAIRIQDIPAYLKETDIVISATTSQLPIIGKGLIESTLHNKKNNPLLLIDLAVPRDIEPEVSTLNQVHLYNIDDLKIIITDNLQNRVEAAKQAEALIDLKANQFYQKMRVFHARYVITEYRQRLEKIRTDEQEKALRQLHCGQDSKVVLEEFGRNLINKIMHHPTVKLREAASEEQCEIFQRIKTFFEIK